MLVKDGEAHQQRGPGPVRHAARPVPSHAVTSSLKKVVAAVETRGRSSDKKLGRGYSCFQLDCRATEYGGRGLRFSRPEAYGT